jgi:hypothetical protein
MITYKTYTLTLNVAVDTCTFNSKKKRRRSFQVLLTTDKVGSKSVFSRVFRKIKVKWMDNIIKHGHGVCVYVCVCLYIYIYVSFERGRNENLKKTWKGHWDFAEKRAR